MPPPDSHEVSDEAPFGWMIDPKTGERRPRKRQGRPKMATEAPVAPVGKSPGLEELQARGALPEPGEDTAPGTHRGRRAKSHRPAEPLPPFRAGVISKGVNRLYRRAGRLIRMWDTDIGTAVIACTVKSDDDDADDDTTVGEAWENLAKGNPRVRAFLLKLLEGGAVTALFVAHLPILMAIVMKDGIRERLPFMQLADAFLGDDEQSGEPSDISHTTGGINPGDMAQMMQMAQGLMGDMAANVNRGPGTPREPTAGQV